MPSRRMTTKIKWDILEKVCDEIYKYKSHPGSGDFCEVSASLVQKHLRLAEQRSLMVAVDGHRDFK